MRNFGPRVAAASATLLALLGLSIGSAQGDGVIETIYVEPTAYVVPSSYVTTSSVVSTGAAYYVPTGYSYVPTSYSYVLPASYATTAYTDLPTSYATTSFVPTSYVATSYRRPGLLRRMFRRPYIETSRTYSYDVAPTVSYLPTTIAYDAGVVATGMTYASPCIETAVAFVPPGPVNGASNGGPGGSMTSQPKNTQEQNYYEPTDKAKAAAKDAGKEKAAASPPDAPAAPAKNSDGAAGLAEPPPDMPKSVTDPQDRGAFRFKATEMAPRVGANASNMLRGEVVSGLDGKRLSKLQVVFTNLTNTYPDRVKTTDANGAFEIFLPTGGWAVKVVDPAAAAGAKPLEYGQVTSTAGRYLDDQDSTIYSLRLTH